ncbi:hypothetical protein GCM10022215_27800 [Nocardioides fonticola]|uniref:Uncharacterized protein n=1 Tax=Nocardioides fonticola TaxID=450363 RepID=A0ABP7XN83_9ACTN
MTRAGKSWGRKQTRHDDEDAGQEVGALATLRDVTESREVGDVTTLADASVMNLNCSGLSTGQGKD